jgi:predicted RNase H-like HicB family nuclease
VDQIEIVPIPSEKGGGYMATMPELGRFAVIGDGKTVQEALDNLKIAKCELFADQEDIDKLKKEGKI